MDEASLDPVSLDPDVLARALSEIARRPADDPVRLRVERVAESLVRDGRRQRSRGRRAGREEKDRAVLAASATGAEDRREDAPPTPARRSTPRSQGSTTSSARSGRPRTWRGAQPGRPWTAGLPW